MTSRVGVAIAAGSIAAGTVTAGWLGHRFGQTIVAERQEEFYARFDTWRYGAAAERAEVSEAVRAAQAWRADASRRLSAMQSRIVRLEAQADALMVRAGVSRPGTGGGEAFNLGRDPGVGGPDGYATSDDGPLLDWDLAAATLEYRLRDRIRQIEILNALLKYSDLRDAVEPEGKPVSKAYVSSAFGSRIDPFTGRKATHKGIDFAGAEGTEIVAVAAGIVTWSGPRAGYGEMVEIDHGRGRTTRYAHNLENLVAVGDVVSRGQGIAKLGSSGRTTGPNLHFEVLVDGVQVNPMPYVE